FSTVLQFSATRSATLSAVGVVSIARNSRIRAPVLIPIGQGIAQVPSPAHVSIPSYWYSYASPSAPSGLSSRRHFSSSQVV
ncbi:MAG: hypothetical protein WA716_17120, partial [Pseudolabrys sp.]